MYKNMWMRIHEDFLFSNATISLIFLASSSLPFRAYKEDFFLLLLSFTDITLDEEREEEEKLP